MALLRRAYGRYRAGGLRAVAAALTQRRQRWQQQTQPLAWAHLGAVSTLLARARPLAQPPVVILSLPRSGSNWVANVLGHASNAACLREPLNATRLEAGFRDGLVPMTGAALHASYRAGERKTALGLPRFPPERHVVLDLSQWAYLQRPLRRLVIKEINPYLAEWFIHALRPRLVYLLRHPAAIALSYFERGWIAGPDPWHRLGRIFSHAQAAAWKALQGYDQVRWVDYDALCAAPEPVFQGLYAFAGLTWTAAVAERLKQQTTSDDAQPYGVHRVSRNQVRAWVGQIAPADLAALRAGYSERPLPWFQAEADWPTQP